MDEPSVQEGSSRLTYSLPHGLRQQLRPRPRSSSYVVVDDGGRVGLLTLSLQRGRLLILHGVGCETATATLPLAVCGQIEFAVVVFFSVVVQKNIRAWTSSRGACSNSRYCNLPYSVFFCGSRADRSAFYRACLCEQSVHAFPAGGLIRGPEGQHSAA